MKKVSIEISVSKAREAFWALSDNTSISNSVKWEASNLLSFEYDSEDEEVVEWKEMLLHDICEILNAVAGEDEYEVFENDVECDY